MTNDEANKLEELYKSVLSPEVANLMCQHVKNNINKVK